MKLLWVFLLSLLDYCLCNSFMAIWFKRESFKDIYKDNKQFFNMGDGE